MKLIADFGGSAPLGELAKALHLTLDEIYHVLETAECLGAVKVEGGRVVLTKRGLELLKMRFGDLYHMVKLKAEERG